MKLKTSLFVVLSLCSQASLCANAAYYMAPLCIGISFAGAFSWSVFRQPTRTPITREEVNPVVLTPIAQKAYHVGDDRVYATLEQAIHAYKKRASLNHAIKQSPKRDLIITRTIPSQDQDPLWLLAPGYKGPRPKNVQKGDISLDSSLHEAATLFCAANIPSPCVTFEFDDSRRSFNFAQKGDITRLSLIYKELAATHSIILFGSCRGGTTMLNVLSNPATPYKDSIKALILESPALSLQKLAQRVGETHLTTIPCAGSLIHTFFRTWFPSYDAQFPSCLSGLEHIPLNLPILIGHVENDKVIAWSDIQELVTGLVATGHTDVYLARINDPSISHARLSSNEDFKNILNAFLAKYTLPHDADKAKNGAKLLENAQQEALRIADETKTYK